MSEMIDRLIEVAQSATFDAHVHRCAVSITGKDARTYHEHVVRKILDAYRSPTPGMLAAGADEIDFQHFAGRSTEVAIAAAFDRMCGEALCDAQMRYGARKGNDDG